MKRLLQQSLRRSAFLLLHNIRSVHNVGAIFRTADAAGISKIYLSGYTPTPTDRFGGVRSDFSKTALGAEKTVLWEQTKNLSATLEKLKKEEVLLIGIEQDKRAVDYKTIKLKPAQSVAFLVGNEVLGFSPALRTKCDLLTEIPMQGKKESLNVSVALGVALFRILNI